MLSKPNQPKNRNFVIMSEINDVMQSLTTSRKIAKKFTKEHKNILAKIRKLEETQAEFSELNFKPAKYVDKKGETRVEYLMTLERRGNE